MASNIWGGNDCLPLVLDRWIADTEGAFLTATLDGRPVGLAKITVLSPGEIWLEGLRVHPSVQGRGLARRITDATFREVGKLAPRSVRFSTSLGNTASRHLGESAGFWQVARIRWMWGRPLGGAVSRSRAATGDEAGTIGDLVRRSGCYRAAGGLAGVGWTFPELTQRRLRRLIGRGQVLVSPAEGTIRAVAIYDFGKIDGDLCLGYIDGPRRNVLSLARDVRRVASRLGKKEASAMLPVGEIADTVRRAGYDENIPVDAVVYELGARGIGEGDEPLESLLGRTVRANEAELADLLAGFLGDRAGRALLRENVRDFVLRHVLEDSRRATQGALQPLSYRLKGWGLRAVYRAIIDHLLAGYGIGRESMRIGRTTASVWHRGTRIATIAPGRTFIDLTLTPGDGPCFPADLEAGGSHVRFDEDSFDPSVDAYRRVMLRIEEPSGLEGALRVIDLAMQHVLTDE